MRDQRRFHVTGRSRMTVGVLAAAALVVSGLLAVSGSATAKREGSASAATNGSRVHVIEHAVTDTVVSPGGGSADKTGNLTGDLLTFHNRVFDPSDTTPVGRDQGSCIRINPADGSWECTWTTLLPRGQVTVEGPYYDTRNSVLAITGGTGAYRTARGQMELNSRNGGKEYDFIFSFSH